MSNLRAFIGKWKRFGCGSIPNHKIMTCRDQAMGHRKSHSACPDPTQLMRRIADLIHKFRW
jgi:hypothetical protein